MDMLPLGIDIAKNSYDVALLVHGRTHTTQFANTPNQFAQLTAWLHQRHGAGPVHACLEAAGRYGDALAAFLHAQGHTVSRINPARARVYARSKLTRNKTDRVDAALLADFCRRQQPRPWPRRRPNGLNCRPWCGIWKRSSRCAPRNSTARRPPRRPRLCSNGWRPI
ncbi:MAG: transposase [Anaerolineales bacterium]|nr:transposase [Anaerolineales bacterium]